MTWQNREQLFVAQELKKYFKLNAAELRIYKYRSIFWVGERLFENCNTATTATKTGLIQGEKIFLKKVSKTFVNRNGNVVTLHSELGKAAASPHALPKGGKSVVTPL